MPESRIDLTLRGHSEAFVLVTGTVDREQAAQLARLLRAAVDGGARQVVVDLAQARTDAPALAALLDAQSRRITALGGWMVVDGGPAAPDDQLPLDALFGIYRQAVAVG